MGRPRCTHDDAERRPSDGRCRACERERKERQRANGDTAISRMDRLERVPFFTRAERQELYARGLDAGAFRPENGRPTVLYGGEMGPETYCPDGYLQGEPCPHGCWSDELEPVRPTRRPRALKPVGPARYVVLEPTEDHPNEARTRRALTYPGDSARGIPGRPQTR